MKKFYIAISFFGFLFMLGTAGAADTGMTDSFSEIVKQMAIGILFFSVGAFLAKRTK